MTDVARLGIEIDSRGVPRADGQLKKLTKTSGGTEKATNKLAGSWRSFSTLILTGGVALAFRSIIRNTAVAERSVAQLRSGLASTGGVSGQTMQSLQALADEMQRTTIYGDEMVESAEAILLSFTEISGEAFPATIRAAADLSSRMGTDLQSSIVQLGKALNAPIQNLSALSRSGIQFTKEQKALIKALWETGQQAEAQTLILKELERQYGGSARAARETLGGSLQALSNSWGDFQEKLGEGMSPSLVVSLEWLASWLGNLDRSMSNVSHSWLRAWANIKLSTQVVWESLKGGWNQLTGGFEDGWNQTVGSIQVKTAEMLDSILSAMHHIKGVSQDTKNAMVDMSTELRASALANIMDTNNQKAATEAFQASVSKLQEEHRKETDVINAGEAAYLRKAAAARVAAQVGGVNEAQLAAMIDKETAAANAIWETAEALTGEEAALVKLAGEQEVFNKEMDRIFEVQRKASQELSENQKLAASGVRSFSDAIVEWASGAEVSFATVAEDFAKMVAKMLLQQALLSAFGLTPTAPAAAAPTALGAAFSGGRRLAFARGGVVTQPTLFPMARGAGLMGEAGPEAVMPLARTSKGELGVNVEGSAPVVNVSIINNTGAKVTERREQRGDSLDIDVMIGDSIANHLNRGTADRAMRDSFGVRRRSAGR